MKASELRDRATPDLEQELLELLREQFNLRMQKSAGQAPRNDQFTKVRRNIARIKTVMSERTAAGKSR